jgi:hypothetical protein
MPREGERPFMPENGEAEESILPKKIDEIYDPYISGEKRRLDTFIAASAELQASIQLIRNPSLTPESFFKMLQGWNNQHQKITGPYVEHQVVGINGQILQIRMDREGNVQLAGTYRQSLSK